MALTATPYDVPMRAMVGADGQVLGHGGSMAPVSSTATTTTVPSANTSATALAANPARKGATFSNLSDQAVDLRFAAGPATTANSSHRVAAGGYYELPFGYTGIITCISGTAGTGNLRVTEFT